MKSNLKQGNILYIVGNSDFISNYYGQFYTSFIHKYDNYLFPLVWQFFFIS